MAKKTGERRGRGEEGEEGEGRRGEEGGGGWGEGGGGGRRGKAGEVGVMVGERGDEENRGEELMDGERVNGREK